MSRADVIVLAVPRRHRGEFSIFRIECRRPHAIPFIAILWPGDTTNVDDETVVVRLDRPHPRTE